MFTAARRARHRALRHPQPCRAHHGPPPFAKLVSRLRQALDGAVQQVAASQEAAGEAVARSTQSVSDAFQRLFPGAPQRRLGSLLASISSTASDSQGAYLPTKNRPVKPGGAQASTPVLTGSSSGGGQEPATEGGDDDQPDQRILISEVGSCAPGT